VLKKWGLLSRGVLVEGTVHARQGAKWNTVDDTMAKPTSSVAGHITVL